ncbi:hypothetical protein [Shimazuella alba]|uniref:Uncharacterized protein n=1 Tax=Shimazuella alba TaxID=2690964 RepID=A0A6I4VX22_9BACL|nr:hypothetical protein [Shimazuella alba]MXQ54470.1 hypothetical protein [Shimazuella alba]
MAVKEETLGGFTIHNIGERHDGEATDYWGVIFRAPIGETLKISGEVAAEAFSVRIVENEGARSIHLVNVVRFDHNVLSGVTSGMVTWEQDRQQFSVSPGIMACFTVCGKPVDTSLHDGGWQIHHKNGSWVAEPYVIE